MLPEKIKHTIEDYLEIFDYGLEHVIELNSKRESVHRVEFILWKDHIVCNVEIDGQWRTCAVPNTITIAEFMLGGELEKMKNWPLGRLYNHC